MPKKEGFVGYLDGIRGVAAFGVFLNHFSLAFYYAWWNQKPETSHLNGLEFNYTHSLFSFLNNGGFCVAIFFVLSGFVLSRKYFLSNDTEVLVSGVQRRFIRLYIPIAFAVTLSYILMSNQLYHNVDASRITLSEWFVKQWRFGDIEKRFLNSVTYSSLLMGDASFDTCLWTMSYEFFGSLFVYAFLLFTHRTQRYRLGMMLVAMLYFYLINSAFYMAFVLGMTLCYTEQWIAKRRTAMTTVIAVALLAVSLMLGSIPFSSPFADSWQDTIKTTIWDYTPWCAAVGGYLLVLSFVLSPILQKVGGLKPFRFLGYISFSLYLLHPILLGSLTSSLFLKFYPAYGYNSAALYAFLITTVVLIGASWVMARYVDQFGINLARRFYEKVSVGTREPRTVTTVVEVPEPTPAKPARKAKA